MALVDQIYDALVDDDALADLPGRLAAFCGARSCSLQSFGKDNAFLLMVNNGYFTEQMYEFYVSSGMYLHDPWRKPYETKHLLSQACLSTELIDMEDYKSSIFYNEFFRRFGDDSAFCLGSVAPHKRGVLTLGLHRGLRQTPFTKDEQASVQPLIPHLRRLFEVRNAFLSSAAQARSAQQLLDGLPQAVLVVNRGGRLEYANSRGEALFAVGGPLTLRGAVVHAREARLDTRLAALISSASEGVAGHGGAMCLASETVTLRVVVVPWRVGERTSVVVLVDDPGDRDPRLEPKLIGLFGLTAMEAATIAALMGGLTPSEVAQARGVALATVRTQIQQAIQKSNERSLADLLRLIASLPRFSPPAH